MVGNTVGKGIFSVFVHIILINFISQELETEN